MSSKPKSARKTQKRNSKQLKRNVPLAQGRTFKQPRFNTRSKNLQTLEIEGTDMFQLPSDEDPSFHMNFSLPANPVHWQGTRLAGIARVYQKYRPIFLRFRYVPNCPATSSGSITMGIIEAGITVKSDTAVTTILNGGGKNINIYQSDSITHIPRYKDDLYTLGDMDRVTVNPFTFYLYTVRQSDVPPGIVYVDWKFQFKMGSGDQQLDISQHTTLTPENILTLQSHNHFYAANLKFGWGSVLGWLKTTGVKILKNIGICICKGILGSLTDNLKSNAIMTQTVQIREAQYFTIDPSDVFNAPSGYIRCKDSSGSDFYLPDQTRVAIYMSGEPVSSPPPTATDGVDISFTTLASVYLAKETVGPTEYTATCNWLNIDQSLARLKFTFNADHTFNGLTVLEPAGAANATTADIPSVSITQAGKTLVYGMHLTYKAAESYSYIVFPQGMNAHSLAARIKSKAADKSAWDDWV